MKKYYPVDFDEKGNAVLGTPKNTPTSDGFIPTTWAPGGSDEGKQGLKSISINPAITTTPALDSVFPIYYDDLTEEEKEDGLEVYVDTGVELVDTDTYTITLTPTEEWYAYNPELEITGEKGEPITFTANPKKGGLLVVGGASNEQDTGEADVVYIELTILGNK